MKWEICRAEEFAPLRRQWEIRRAKEYALAWRNHDAWKPHRVDDLGLIYFLVEYQGRICTNPWFSSKFIFLEVLIWAWVRVQHEIHRILGEFIRIAFTFDEFQISGIKITVCEGGGALLVSIATSCKGACSGTSFSSTTLSPATSSFTSFCNQLWVESNTRLLVSTLLIVVVPILSNEMWCRPCHLGAVIPTLYEGHKL